MCGKVNILKRHLYILNMCFLFAHLSIKTKSLQVFENQDFLSHMVMYAEGKPHNYLGCEKVLGQIIKNNILCLNLTTGFWKGEFPFISNEKLLRNQQVLPMPTLLKGIHHSHSITVTNMN